MGRGLSYEDCRRLLEGRRLPAAFVDLDAFDANLDRILARMGETDKTLRIASKSVRCAALLRRLMERGAPRTRGLMGYAVEEAAYLADQGFDDILVAYPTVREPDMELLAELARAGKDVQLVVDAPEHIRAMSRAGRAAGVELAAVVDVDMSFRPLGHGLHIGVRRSALRDGPAVYALVREADRLGGVRVAGIMGYEAQIAGLADENPFSPALNPVRKLIRALSKPAVRRTRDGVVRYLEKRGVGLRIVNGGGTGSVDSTSQDDCVTEVTAGSGFFCPHLFSYYSNLDLEPAAFFALQAVRRPARGMVTCQGGGYIASGEMGPDRLPVPYLPEGLELLKVEGAGEVQTPVVAAARSARLPGLGEPVIFRHAKAGELSERFNSYLLVQGGEIVGEEPTYRGHGMCFV